MFGFSFLFLFSIVVAVTKSALFEQCLTLFDDFKTQYKIKYSSSIEEEKRKLIFCGNMKLADSFNIDNGSPVFGVSKFADRTQDEYSILLGRKDKGTFNMNNDLNQVNNNIVVRNPYLGPEQYGMKQGKSIPYKGSLPEIVDWTAIEGIALRMS